MRTWIGRLGARTNNNDDNDNDNNNDNDDDDDDDKNSNNNLVRVLGDRVPACGAIPSRPATDKCRDCAISRM